MGTGRSSGRGRNSVPGVLTCAGLIRKALAAALSGLDGIVGVLNAAGTTRKPKACHPGKHEVLATTTGDQDPTGIDLCPRGVLNRSPIFLTRENDGSSWIEPRGRTGHLLAAELRGPHSELVPADLVTKGYGLGQGEERSRTATPTACRQR